MGRMVNRNQHQQHGLVAPPLQRDVIASCIGRISSRHQPRPLSLILCRSQINHQRAVFNINIDNADDNTTFASEHARNSWSNA